MHKTLAELVETFVLCIGEAEMTYTSTSSVTVISALCNWLHNVETLRKLTALLVKVVMLPE